MNPYQLVRFGGGVVDNGVPVATRKASPRLAAVTSFFPCRAVRLDLLALLDVERLARLVELER